jgi:hypothetical protein
MKNVLAIAFALALMAAPMAAAQNGSGAGSGSGVGRGSGAGDEQATTPTKTQVDADVQKTLENKKMLETKVEAAAQNNPRFVRTLTNVQIELTLSDQMGAAAPAKKTVSMIASSGNWGKIRSVATVLQIGEGPYPVELNVDARPFVSIEGPIQLELTLSYMPVKDAGDPKVGPKQRGAGINQSQTVILHSGKSLTISQAADPLSDRKVTVDVKATVLK